MKHFKLMLLLTIVAGAFCSISYSVRAFLPYPTNYVMRLKYLNGWQSRGYYGFNCSALATNAHGEVYRTERELYAGDYGKLELVAQLANRDSLKDFQGLQPGDLAVFQGPNQMPYLGRGIHVAIYLGPGDWIDGDVRRGYVSRHELNAPTDDVWFQGKVRILRWRDKPDVHWQVHAAQFTSWFVDMCCVNDYRLNDQFSKVDQPNFKPFLFKNRGKNLE